VRVFGTWHQLPRAAEKPAPGTVLYSWPEAAARGSRPCPGRPLLIDSVSREQDFGIRERQIAAATQALYVADEQRLVVSIGCNDFCRNVAKSGACPRPAMTVRSDPVDVGRLALSRLPVVRFPRDTRSTLRPARSATRRVLRRLQTVLCSIDVIAPCGNQRKIGWM